MDGRKRIFLITIPKYTTLSNFNVLINALMNIKFLKKLFHQICPVLRFFSCDITAVEFQIVSSLKYHHNS